ncbi:hypothetical protein H2248_012213 [Termitomyces sp. 'cryptogamus']|nr:hypothetical protein H2248_012213 [Termitomyces sp. 'cryptogamus']
MPIAPLTKENDNVQGSIAFFFHENRDKNRDPNDTVLGVSTSHVLSKDITIDYQFKGPGAPMQSIQHALNEIKDCITSHATNAECLAKHIIKLEAELESKDLQEAKNVAELLMAKQAKLAQEKEDIDTLKKFYNEVTSGNWADIKYHSIKYFHWAPNISINVQGHKYTKDISIFMANPSKFRA